MALMELTVDQELALIANSDPNRRVDHPDTPAMGIQTNVAMSAPRKRGRGRPPKRSRRQADKTEDDISSPKRGRGRPRKPVETQPSPKIWAKRGRPKSTKMHKAQHKNVFTDKVELPSKRISKQPARYGSKSGGTDDLFSSMLKACLDQHCTEICTYLDMRIAKVERRLDAIESSLQQLHGTQGS